MKQLAVCLVVMTMWPLTVFGFGADEALPDPAQEARAHVLFKQLRCLVCQNQSIEDSGADLAVDLRAVVREQIAAGLTDAQVRQYMVERYGEWVLMEPPLNMRTVVLWAVPGLALALAALIGGWAVVRRPRGGQGLAQADTDAEDMAEMRQRLATYQAQQQEEKS